jgi:hypothetical protein
MFFSNEASNNAGLGQRQSDGPGQRQSQSDEKRSRRSAQQGQPGEDIFVQSVKNARSKNIFGNNRGSNASIAPAKAQDLSGPRDPANNAAAERVVLASTIGEAASSFQAFEYLLFQRRTSPFQVFDNSSMSMLDIPVKSNWFPLGTSAFVDESEFFEYEKFRKGYFNFWSVLPIVLVSFVYDIMHYNFSYAFSDGSMFSVAFIFMLVQWLLWSSLIYSQAMYYVYGDTEEFESSVSFRILTSWWGERTETMIGVLTTISSGLLLLARVAKGKCDGSSSLWEAQRCNPTGPGGLPHDELLRIILLPLLVQFVLKGTGLLTGQCECVIIAMFLYFRAVVVNESTANKRCLQISY